jgi:hypothetical protein
MKAYLLVTGLTFLAVTIAHLLRMAAEPHLAGDPWYLVLTAAVALLAGWACRLYVVLGRDPAAGTR